MRISLHRLEWRAAAGVCSPPERSATRCRRPRRPRAAAGGSRRPEGRLDPLDRGAVLASALHFPQIPHDRPVSPPQSTVSCRYAMLTGAVASCWESWEGSWAREELWAGFGCAAAWPWRCSRSGLSQPAPLISWKTMVLVGRSQPAHEPEPSTRLATVRHAAVSAAGLNDGAQCTTSPFGPSHLRRLGPRNGPFRQPFRAPAQLYPGLRAQHGLPFVC